MASRDLLGQFRAERLDLALGSAAQADLIHGDIVLGASQYESYAPWRRALFTRRSKRSNCRAPKLWIVCDRSRERGQCFALRSDSRIRQTHTRRGRVNVGGDVQEFVSGDIRTLSVTIESREPIGVKVRVAEKLL